MLAVSIAIVVVLSMVALGVAIEERRWSVRAEMQQHYLESILLGNTEGERYLESLSQLSNKKHKRVAAEVIAMLTPIVYRIDQEQLLRVSSSLHLPEYLYNEALRSRGTKRLRALLLLSQTPLINITPQQLETFTKDKNRMVRFFALLATINSDNSNVLHYIAAYTSPLTPFELSQLLNLLCRGSMVVAYFPMLASQSHNLNMLGLAVIRKFGIESAKRELRRMVECGAVDSLRREALYTLASMQLTLCTPSIASYVGRMAIGERLRFLRYIVYEGYSQRVVDFFATHHEQQSLHSLIDSYKIKIRCF